MIKSMTGYGTGQLRAKGGLISAEIKTLNHRYLDIVTKLPVQLNLFEDKIRELIQHKLKRGRVNVSISTNEGLTTAAGKFYLDKKLAMDYHKLLKTIKSDFKIKEDISIAHLVGLPGIINFEPTKMDMNNLWPKIKIAIEKALGDLIRSRTKEGKKLFNQLNKAAKVIEACVLKIEERSPEVVQYYRRRLQDMAKKIFNIDKLDRARLETEVALFAKDSDVAEELTRLKSHLANFKNCLFSDGEVGRKLDFIAQELQREANTISSKAQDFKIQNLVIRVKDNIEKIREQAQNIE